MTTGDPKNLAQQLIDGEIDVSKADPRYRQALESLRCDLSVATKMARQDGTCDIVYNFAFILDDGSLLAFDYGLISPNEAIDMRAAAEAGLEEGETVDSRMTRIVRTAERVRASAEWPVHLDQIIAALVQGYDYGEE